MAKAPNYDGEFPGAGARVGPCWQRLWDELEDGKWHSGPEISKKLHGDVADRTARDLLANAAKKGVLKRTLKKMPRSRNGQYWYRRDVQ